MAHMVLRRPTAQEAQKDYSKSSKGHDFQHFWGPVRHRLDDPGILGFWSSRRFRASGLGSSLVAIRMSVLVRTSNPSP